MFETGDPKGTGFTHTLLLVVDEGRWGLFDAWSECDALWVEGLSPADIFAEWSPADRPVLTEPLDGVREYQEWVRAGATWAHDGLCAREAILAGHAISPEQDEHTRRQVTAVTEEAVDAFLSHDPVGPVGPVDPSDPGRVSPAWAAFLELRGRILADEVHAPKPALGQLLRDHKLGGLTRKLVEHLQRRA